MATMAVTVGDHDAMMESLEIIAGRDHDIVPPFFAR